MLANCRLPSDNYTNQNIIIIIKLNCYNLSEIELAKKISGVNSLIKLTIAV